MSRRTAIIIVIVILVVILGGLFGFYSYLSQKNSGSPYSGSSFSLKDFFPFGGGSSSNSNNGSTSGNNSASSSQSSGINGSTPVPLLRQISNLPVAGASLYDRQVSTTTFSASSTKPKTIKITQTFIEYLDRATGQAYQTMTNNLVVNRLSNTTFPKVYQAYFDSVGSSTVMQTLASESGDTINTYFGTLLYPKNTTSTSTTGAPSTATLSTTLLSNNIYNITVSPDKTSIFSLFTSNGNPGIISHFDGSKQNTIWTSPLSEWIATWPNSKDIVLTTKASATVPGYSYLLNTTSGNSSKLLGNVDGLTTLVSPNLSTVLFSSSDANDGSFSLNLFTPSTNATSTLFVQTLPEKCVWSSDNVTIYCGVPNVVGQGTYPDDWYKGIVSFSDSIWKINVSTGQANRIANLSAISNQNIDATNLMLDAKEDYLMFTNKRDLTLWGLQLSTETGTSTTQ